MGSARGMTQNRPMGLTTIMGSAGPNTIGSCCNDPTTYFDLQTAKIMPPQVL